MIVRRRKSSQILAGFALSRRRPAIIGGAALNKISLAMKE